ncbi:MAG: UDP-N-acetylmuramate dehydrogenase [Mycobacteriales bacterium]
MLTGTAEPLARWTTLRLGGPAAEFREATSTPDLYDAVAAADRDRQAVLVLGGGSNLLVADEGFPGRVVRVATTGIAVRVAAGDVEVTVAAGETWDTLVAHCVESGWAGVEALSGIPGTVGAAPIQNVGAYGQEVRETVTAVEVYDRAERVVRTLTNAECIFSYRGSVFKARPGRYVVGSVTLRLRADEAAGPIRYAELASALGGAGASAGSIGDVRRAVLAIRDRKGMVLRSDDHDTWSAGSFFTNPMVAAAEVPAEAPAYPQPDGTVKTSAAWLIERAGFTKGYGTGPARLSTKHPLAITNRGGATTADVLALARVIRETVQRRFGIELRTEPVLVGCQL